MCGRFTLTASPPEVAEHFGAPLPAGGLPELRPRYNIAPAQDVVVVTRTQPRRAAFAVKRWGLVPPWARDPGFGNQAINARIESADRKPAFRDAFAARRCLVPADGFYEWRGRDPFHIALPGREVFAFAGLHERWHAPDGARLETFTVLTGPAHSRIRELHDRMPLLVPRPHYEAWLDPELRDPDRVRALLDPEQAAAFEPRAVDVRVNSPRHDDAACLEPPRQLGLL